MRIVFSRAGKSFCCVLVVALCAGAASPTAPEPQWKADLSHYVTTPRDRPLPFGIVYLSPDRLLAYFVQPPASPGLRGRAPSTAPDTYRLHVLLIDPATGSVTSSGDLPAAGHGALRVMPTAAGNLVVKLADSLNVYSPEFRLLAHRDLPRGDRDFWVAKVSPSGRVLWLHHSFPFRASSTAPAPIERLNPDTLDRLSGCVGPVMTEFSSVSDDRILREAQNAYVVENFACATQYVVRHPSNLDYDSAGCGMVHALVGETLIVGGCGTVAFTTLSGMVQARDSFSARDFIDLNPQISRDQGTLAISTHREKSADLGSADLKKFQLRVYDVPTHQLLGVLRFATTTPAFALSPDGRSLVTLSSTGRLELYRTDALSPAKK